MELVQAYTNAAGKPSGFKLAHGPIQFTIRTDRVVNWANDWGALDQVPDVKDQCPKAPCPFLSADCGGCTMDLGPIPD